MRCILSVSYSFTSIFIRTNQPFLCGENSFLSDSLFNWLIDNVIFAFNDEFDRSIDRCKNIFQFILMPILLNYLEVGHLSFRHYSTLPHFLDNYCERMERHDVHGILDFDA